MKKAKQIGADPLEIRHLLITIFNPRKMKALRLTVQRDSNNVAIRLFKFTGIAKQKDGVDLSNHTSRKRNIMSIMCEIYNVGFEIKEGLDVHFQTEQHQKHQKNTMDIALHVKQHNQKKRVLVSKEKKSTITQHIIHLVNDLDAFNRHSWNLYAFLQTKKII